MKLILFLSTVAHLLSFRMPLFLSSQRDGFDFFFLYLYVVLDFKVNSCQNVYLCEYKAELRTQVSER